MTFLYFLQLLETRHELGFGDLRRPAFDPAGILHMRCIRWPWLRFARHDRGLLIDEQLHVSAFQLPRFVAAALRHREAEPLGNRSDQPLLDLLKLGEVLLQRTGHVADIRLGRIMHKPDECKIGPDLMRDVNGVLGHRIETRAVGIEAAQHRQRVCDVFNPNGARLDVEQRKFETGGGLNPLRHETASDLSKETTKNAFAARVNSRRRRKISNPNQMGVNMEASEDWGQLKRRYKGYQSILTPYELPHKDEFKLSQLTFGNIESAHLDKITYGFRFYADDEDARHLLDHVAARLGFKPNNRPGWRSPFEVVEQGIENQSATLEFARAWGAIEYCVGVMSTLIRREHLAKEAYFRRLNAAKHDAIVQKHWYAHWMAANVPSLNKDARSDEDARLATLCGEIEAGHIAPWGTYPKEWFGSLLLRKDRTALNETLTRLSKPAIFEMLEHPLLTPDVLPPLRRQAFQRIGDSKP
jgi:hypothetical protein